MIVEHVFFDLDGTLIGSSGDVKDTVWAAIEPLRGRVGLSVCTGRPRAGVAQRVAARLDPEGLHVFENGALVARPTGEPVHVSKLDPGDLAAIAAAAQHIDATVEFYTASGVFVSRLDDDCIAHGIAIGIEPQLADLTRVIATHDVFRAHWIMRSHVLDEVLAVRLSDAEIGVASSPVMPGIVFGSTTRRGTSKGRGAEIVADLTGASLASSIGIGDAVGDLPLLEAVGYPFVVANAPTELRVRFEVLGDVDADGVEPLLRRLSHTRS